VGYRRPAGTLVCPPDEQGLVFAPHEGDPLITTGTTGAQPCPTWCRSHRARTDEGGHVGVTHCSETESWSDKPEHYVQLCRHDSVGSVGRAQIHFQAGDREFVLDDVDDNDVGALAVAMMCLRADSLPPIRGADQAAAPSA
jgi:hypothetical protein